MTSTAGDSRKKWLRQAAGLAIAGAFLWLAFRGIDFSQFWDYVRQVKPLFIGLLFITGISSHILRVWRWNILMAPLADHKISFWNSFCALMYGYAVNVVIPRGGEVARLVAISRSERLPWAGVLSTVFIDRLLDVVLLVLLLGATLAVFPTQAAHDLPWLVPGGISLCVASILGLVLLPQMGKVMHWILDHDRLKSKVPAPIVEKLSQLTRQFDLGTRSLRNVFAYPAITALSLGMWFLYWLNFYVMIWGFGLETKVDPAQCLIVFTIGSVGVLVPTPGNVGSFHFLVSQALVMVSGVNQNLALAYASVLHLMCFVGVTVIPAAVCMVAQSTLGGGAAIPTAGDLDQDLEVEPDASDGERQPKSAPAPSSRTTGQ